MKKRGVLVRHMIYAFSRFLSGQDEIEGEVALDWVMEMKEKR